MSERDKKPPKIRRRRTTGRVSGTTQSDFAANSMSSILEQQAENQARKQAESEAEQEDGEGKEAENDGKEGKQGPTS